MTDGKTRPNDDLEDDAEDRGESAAEAALRDGAGDMGEDPAEDAAMHETDAEGAGVVEEEPADDLEAALTTALSERDELRDRLMRALAETENVRKRAERDVKDAQAYAGTKLARDLLGVYDNLSRALDAADDAAREAAGPVIEGVELTQRELLSAFAKHKIEAVVPEMGEKFDAKLHQAMFEAPVEGAAPGTVIQVMACGFTISGRLLRPAMVGVAAG
ncbi:MAG: nucleotide exchange factor GrpE [Pseudomonadota bacterium]|nr:nucleotide exchange factor GrpE [Pseudomonadota bacterium]MEE3100398.1 nucleotide exchange factor GrpE [Pseudomonadota bacterium]